VAAPDPLAVINRARALVATVDGSIRDALRVEPVDALVTLGITLIERPGMAGCDLDASWDSATRTIRVASDASPSRFRFSCLHELGHERVEVDPQVNDWLYDLGVKYSVVALEQVCDAFAAELLLPQDEVAAALQAGFRARHVAALYAGNTASREAVCVRAAQQLGGPGLIALARGNTVLFSSSWSLGFRIGRGVTQPAESVVTRAASQGHASTAAERVQLRSMRSFTDLTGDAVLTDDGYTFAVLRQTADEVDHQGRPLRKTWTCKRCGDDITDSGWCDDCRQRICPECGCDCPPMPAIRRAVCAECGVQLPLVGDECGVCGSPIPR
jgi:hypothetical protein